MRPDEFLGRFPWVPAVILLAISFGLIVQLGIQSPFLIPLLITTGMSIPLLALFLCWPRRQRSETGQLWPPVLPSARGKRNWIPNFRQRIRRPNVQSEAMPKEPPKVPVQATLPIFGTPGSKQKQGYIWDKSKGID